jgi:predicted kinase
MGVEPATHLPPETYTKAASRDVYRRLFERAEAVLSAGHAVLLDGAFLDPAEREMAEAMALRLGIRFHGIWLEAAPDLLVARVEARSGDASDADATVVRRQLESDVGPIGWTRLEAGGAIEETVGAAAVLLALPGISPTVW